LKTGKELRRIKGDENEFWDIALSSDYRWLATAGPGNDARLWDLEKEKRAHVYTGHSDLVVSIAVSPDQHYLLTGSNDRTARLWDVESGQEVQRYTASAAVSHVAFSPDGSLVLLEEGVETRILKREDGTEVLRFDSPAISFSPDGQFLLMQNGDLFSMQSRLVTRRLGRHLNKVSAIALSGDGRTLVMGSEDKTLRVWDMARGAEIRRMKGVGPFSFTTPAPVP
jgi:WD40 repeat protein